MGKSAASGPFYGSKSLLWSVSADRPAGSSVAVTMGGITIPVGQDWYVTEFMAFRGSTESTACVASLLDDSTSIATIAITSSAAGVAGSTAPTATPGEYEGLQVAAGSSVTISLANSNSTLVAANWQFWVYGYPRFISSTRPE